MANATKSGLGMLMFVSAALSAPLPTSAQLAADRPALPNMTPFAIVTPATFPYAGADAVIVRSMDEDIRDVILVRRGKASATLLAAAVRQLAGLRALSGDNPTGVGTFRVQDNGRQWTRPGEASDWVASLGRSKSQPIAGFGRVPHLILYMPNQHK